MATVGWTGRKATLTILNGGTISDVLDMGRMEPDIAKTSQVMVKGTAAGADLILLNGQEAVTVVSIVSVVQGGTTYTVTTDYVLGTNTVDWSPAGAEPAVGSLYTVTYTYKKTVGAKSYRRWDIDIKGPSALTGTVTLQGCETEAGTFVAQQSGGADITIAAVKLVPIIPALPRFIRLVSGSAEGAQRDFVVQANTQIQYG